ncbi:MAG TPA: ATP-binding protein [Ramlibacter sp.]|nr:ATP-binding protein [Ramlibacter sp.]
MSPGYSIRARLLLGGALVLLAFLVGAGAAVQRAHADSVRAVHLGRLQGTVYLLLAGAEVDAAGALVMPPGLAEPRLMLPGSGLYASISNPARAEQWRSPSTLGLQPPFRRSQPVGAWRHESVEEGGKGWLAVTYSVNWAGRDGAVPLVLSVLEDRATFDAEVRIFARTLWAWLGSAGVLLLLAQLLLLRWGLAPLRRVAGEIRRIEEGEQEAIEGSYPTEITGLTGNLNALLRHERVRQARYKEALSFLAHSLKTPLAVLRNTLAEPAQLPAAVEQQVARMDDIVQHQLGRAAAGGGTRFARPIELLPVMDRIRDALAKVYAEKKLALAIEGPPQLRWRIDEGDAFEMLGNVMDNAAKWARGRVTAKAVLEAGSLVLQVDDDGPGFSDTESVLGLHVRGDERVPGHGVGLAVVKDLVASHGGELRLTATESGGGRVRIVLPPP